MNSNEMRPDIPDSFDHLLNATLHNRAQTEPLAGLESRILARVAAAAPGSPAQESLRPLWRWAALATTAAALCTVAFLAHQPHLHRIADPQQTSATAIARSSRPAKPDNGSGLNAPNRDKGTSTLATTGGRLAVAAIPLSILSSRSNANGPAVLLQKTTPENEASLPKLETFPSTSSKPTNAKADQPPLIAIRVEVDPSSADKLEIAELKTTSIPLTTMPTIQELP